MKHFIKLSCLSILVAFSSCEAPNAGGEAVMVSESSDRVNDYGEAGYPTEVYFGDTHLHTELSMDAGAFGNRLSMDEAYRFARGEQVKSSTGLNAQLKEPLDFLVVADHTDGMGLFQAVMTGEDWVMEYPQGKRWNKMINEGNGGEAAVELIKAFSQGEMDMNPNDKSLMSPLWKEVMETAAKYNEPGKFTSLLGYEWTSLLKGNNLHRVVVFRDNEDRVGEQLPAITYEKSEGGSPDPEDLWKHLQAYEEMTGGRVLAIPHNGNLSNGIMFAETKVNGEPYDESYVKERIKWEPLYEVTQIKGDGEAHPFLSPNDEFADFENWSYGNLDLSAKKTNDMLEGEYGRSALKLGLKLKNQLGTNPYKFGMIGSTDSHTSLATADQDIFFGKAANVEPYAERWEHPFVASEIDTIFTWATVASGYAAVWATENTREALFDGMMRKETYATTGPRMKVRFFGGWDYTPADLDGNWVKNGYDKGVPMGGDLKYGGSEGPSFIVQASMDPNTGSLDRIQVVKGWANADGSLSEKVYDVVWSGDRTKGANGKVPAIENTVNLIDATWDNDSGARELAAVWQDPDFDASQEAFYYVRVLEIPTPRWTLYDKINYKLDDMPDYVPLTAQQRAYSSPIWYSPK